MLKVTAVKVFPIEKPLGKTLGFAQVTISEELRLTELRIIDGANGLFVAYPNNPSIRDGFRALFYPLTISLRNEIEEAVIKEYNECMEKNA